jgi:hypothetical protein
MNLCILQRAQFEVHVDFYAYMHLLTWILGWIVPLIQWQGLQASFEGVQAWRSNDLLWKAVPQVHHSVAEELFPDVGSTELLPQFQVVTSEGALRDAKEVFRISFVKPIEKLVDFHKITNFSSFG